VSSGGETTVVGPRFTARALFVTSAVFVVYATTIPWDLTEPPSLERLEWVPLWDAERGRPSSLPDLVQNVVLFLPFGVFGALGLARARRGSVLRGAAMVGLFGLLLSAIVEVLQTMSHARTPSTSDIVANTAGAVIGATIGLVYARAIEHRLAVVLRAILDEQPGLLVFVASLGAVIAGALAPFLPTLDVSALRATARALLDDPWGSKSLAALVAGAPPWLALGFLSARELAPRLDPRRDPPSRAGAVVAITFVAATATILEAAQLFFVGHGPRLQDAALGAVAGALGVMSAVAAGGGRLASARTIGESSRRHPALVLTFALAAPTLRALAPFELVPIQEKLASLSGWQLVPFWALFDHLTVWSFSNVFEAIAVFVPLAWLLRASGASAALAIVACAGLAEVLEVLQLGIAGRTFDITEGVYGAASAAVASFVFARVSSSAARPTREPSA
jgi:VanZ family protein